MAISDRAQQTTDRLQKFMDKNIYPNNDTYKKQIDDFGDSSIPNLFVTSSITLVEVQILIGIP